MRLIDQVRAAVGPSPRQGDWVRRPDPPAWATDVPSFRRTWQRTEALARDGVVVWGQLVMANGDLFQEGPDDAPAAIVYSFDPIFDRHPEWLEPVARQIYAFYEGDEELSDDPLAACPLAPSVANLRHRVRTGTDHDLAYRVPTMLSGGRVVYLTSLMVHRVHLPGGVLRGERMPLLAERHLDEPTTMIVPSDRWPDSLRASWA